MRGLCCLGVDVDVDDRDESDNDDVDVDVEYVEVMMGTSWWRHDAPVLHDSRCTQRMSAITLPTHSGYTWWYHHQRLHICDLSDMKSFSRFILFSSLFPSGDDKPFH